MSLEELFKDAPDLKELTHEELLDVAEKYWKLWKMTQYKARGDIETIEMLVKLAEVRL